MAPNTAIYPNSLLPSSQKAGLNLFDTDQQFADGTTVQLAADVLSVATSRYLSALEVAISQTVVTSPRNTDRETGGQFVLGQNYPNPHLGETTVPFTLTNPADVRLDLFDPLGRKVFGIARKGLEPGLQTIYLNIDGLGLLEGMYSYQLQVTNRRGVFRHRRTMMMQ